MVVVKVIQWKPWIITTNSGPFKIISQTTRLALVLLLRSMYVVPLLPHKRKIDGPRQNNVGKFQLSFAINLASLDSINFCPHVEKSHLIEQILANTTISILDFTPFVL